MIYIYIYILIYIYTIVNCNPAKWNITLKNKHSTNTQKKHISQIFLMSTYVHNGFRADFLEKLYQDRNGNRLHHHHSMNLTGIFMMIHDDNWINYWWIPKNTTRFLWFIVLVHFVLLKPYMHNHWLMMTSYIKHPQVVTIMSHPTLLQSSKLVFLKKKKQEMRETVKPPRCDKWQVRELHGNPLSHVIVKHI